MSAVVRPRPFPQESECCMVVCISTGPYKTPVSGSSHRPEIWLVLDARGILRQSMEFMG